MDYLCKVKITATDAPYGSNSPELRLPANQEEMIAALDRAQVPQGSGDYTLDPTGGPESFFHALYAYRNPPSLAEANALAERLNQLTGEQVRTLDGLTQRAHNIDNYDRFPQITNYQQLGEHALEVNAFPWAENLSGEIVEFLDVEKIGRTYGERNRGVLSDT